MCGIFLNIQWLKEFRYVSELGSHLRMQDHRFLIVPGEGTTLDSTLKGHSGRFHLVGSSSGEPCPIALDFNQSRFGFF